MKINEDGRPVYSTAEALRGDGGLELQRIVRAVVKAERENRGYRTWLPSWPTSAGSPSSRSRFLR